MGYTTDFSGSFEITPTLKPEHLAYLQAFNRTRRMSRNAEMVATTPDPLREAVGLPVGEQGAYCVSSTEDFGQSRTPDIVDYNNPPSGQPGLWCQWVPTDDGNTLEWDEGEKFYRYTEWLEYLIENFFKPWGYLLNGSVSYQGEDSDDRGIIRPLTITRYRARQTLSATRLLNCGREHGSRSVFPPVINLQEKAGKLMQLPLHLESNPRFKPGGIIVDLDSQVIAHIYRDSDQVLRVLNSHEAIVDALTLALPYVESALEDQGYKPGAVDRMVKTIREALRLAEGEGA